MKVNILGEQISYFFRLPLLGKPLHRLDARGRQLLDIDVLRNADASVPHYSLNHPILNAKIVQVRREPAAKGVPRVPLNTACGECRFDFLAPHRREIERPSVQALEHEFSSRIPFAMFRDRLGHDVGKSGIAAVRAFVLVSPSCVRQ